LIEVTGCPQLKDNDSKALEEKMQRLSAFNSQTGICDVVKKVKIPKQSSEFSMIKVEFSELEDKSLLNAVSVAEYVGVEFKSKNGELKIYQETLTIVFFIANLINLAFYWYKLA